MQCFQTGRFESREQTHEHFGPLQDLIGLNVVSDV